ncbi:hypothetical protein AB2B41_01455 [Marimonas sp. MJW-29]|uniref:Uncharacterized protein n=1 Tax=Sulfitobacter sediminis TaxID=3234186 RepID=A0ABV3RHQ5_9RHOB
MIISFSLVDHFFRTLLPGIVPRRRLRSHLRSHARTLAAGMKSKVSFHDASHSNSEISMSVLAPKGNGFGFRLKS